MSYNTPDVYYQPENFGLTQVAQIEWAEPDYSFNMGVVWKDADGQLFYGEDSGCSCPSPFEDFTSLESLEKLTFPELEAKLKERAETEYIYEGSSYALSRDELRARVVDAILKIKES